MLELLSPFISWFQLWASLFALGSVFGFYQKIGFFSQIKGKFKSEWVEQAQYLQSLSDFSYSERCNELMPNLAERFEQKAGRILSMSTVFLMFLLLLSSLKDIIPFAISGLSVIKIYFSFPFCYLLLGCNIVAVVFCVLFRSD